MKDIPLKLLDFRLVSVRRMIFDVGHVMVRRMGHRFRFRDSRVTTQTLIPDNVGQCFADGPDSARFFGPGRPR